MVRVRVAALRRVLALLALLAFCLGAPAAAWAKYEPPPLRGHVVDEANVLDDAAERQLDARLDALRTQKGFAIVVYLPASLKDLPIEDVAYDTFNTWGVGATGKDDGVLVVVANTERKMRIETGKGVGDRLTDVQSSRIIREVMAPRLAAGDLPGALDGGTRSIERLLTGENPADVLPPQRTTQRRPTAKPMSTTQKLVIGGVILLVIILSIVSRSFRRVLFSILEVMLWAAFFSRGGGGGGGGGGGYGGGGGRSGGGGASGGW